MGRPSKITAKMRAEWARLRPTLSDTMIAEQYGVTESAIRYHLGPRTAPTEQQPPPRPSAKVAAAAPAPHEDVEMTPEEFGTWLGVELRKAQATANECRAAGDSAGAGRAMRLAAQLAAILAKQHARTADDGDVVRVKSTDMRDAAERARSKLQDLYDRLRQDRQKGAA